MHGVSEALTAGYTLMSRMSIIFIFKVSYSSHDGNTVFPSKLMGQITVCLFLIFFFMGSELKKLMKLSQILVIFLYIHGHFRPLALAANSRLVLGKSHGCGFDTCVLSCVPPSIYGCQMFFSHGHAPSRDTVTMCTWADYISRFKLAGGTFSCITILCVILYTSTFLIQYSKDHGLPEWWPHEKEKANLLIK